jgi:[lysine-biosynthesis-protein LysW]--L-2-aminoadipate ligase
MSKVCIVFDRLRAEEKMLKKEASELGHEALMLDAKITQVNTDSKKEDFDLGDVVLERCVSYFRGLHFTASLEFMDIPVLNKFEVANICGNKMFMTLLLKKNNIPTPKTYFSFSSESAAENLEKVGFPLVIKPVIGSWGRGVMPLKDKDTMEAVFEIRDITDSPHDRIYYLQELIQRPYRKSSGGFKTNIALGADPELCEITKEMEDMATKASKAMGGGILGIDMMEDKERGLVVHEVNNTVEFKGLARVAQRNIPKEMIEFALNYVRK